MSTRQQLLLLLRCFVLPRSPRYFCMGYTNQQWLFMCAACTISNVELFFLNSTQHTPPWSVILNGALVLGFGKLCNVTNRSHHRLFTLSILKLRLLCIPSFQRCSTGVCEDKMENEDKYTAFNNINMAKLLPKHQNLPNTQYNELWSYSSKIHVAHDDPVHINLCVNSILSIRMCLASWSVSLLWRTLTEHEIKQFFSEQGKEFIICLDTSLTPPVWRLAPEDDVCIKFLPRTQF